MAQAMLRPGGAMSPRGADRRTVVLLAVVLLGAAALYAPFVDHPFMIDDAVQIHENTAVTRGAPIASFFLDRDTTSSRPDYNTRIYRPLRNLGFRAIAVVSGASVAGLRPLPYGLANLVLYLACVALVFAIARKLVGEPAAILAAALFAVAPVHVEAVLYASAFGNLLSAALELAALLVAIAAVDADRRARAAGLAAASLVLAASSMAAKEMAVTGVAVLALWLWARRTLWRRRGLALVGAHGFVACAYLVLRTAVLGQVGQEAVTARTLASGLREAPWLLIHYARLAVLPLGHSAAYAVSPPSVIGLVGTLALIAAVALVSRRVPHPAVWFGLAWFVVSLLPVLHLVPLWADLADRFAFVPSVGLALCAAGVIDLALSAQRARSVFAVGAALLALYSVGTVLSRATGRATARSGRTPSRCRRLHRSRSRTSAWCVSVKGCQTKRWSRSISPSPSVGPVVMSCTGGRPRWPIWAGLANHASPSARCSSRIPPSAAPMRCSPTSRDSSAISTPPDARWPGPRRSRPIDRRPASRVRPLPIEPAAAPRRPRRTSIWRHAFQARHGSISWPRGPSSPRDRRGAAPSKRAPASRSTRERRHAKSCCEDRRVGGIPAGVIREDGGSGGTAGRERKKKITSEVVKSIHSKACLVSWCARVLSPLAPPAPWATPARTPGPPPVVP